MTRERNDRSERPEKAISQSVVVFPLSSAFAFLRIREFEEIGKNQRGMRLRALLDAVGSVEPCFNRDSFRAALRTLVVFP